MPTASARFRRPRPQPRVISQLELLVSRLIMNSALYCCWFANSETAARLGSRPSPNFAFAHARWATIQIAVAGVQDIALGADKMRQNSLRSQRRTPTSLT